VRPPRALLCLALVLAAPLAPAAAPRREVVIGLLYPLSGPTAPAAIAAKHAFELVADMVNGAEPMLPGASYQKLRGLSGFPGGARLRLVFVDHRGRPDLGQMEAERLINLEKVHALIGSWQSSVTAATSRVAERLEVPHLSADSASPVLTRRGLKWFFRTSPHDEHIAQALFDFLADFHTKTGIRLETVAISHEDTLVGTDTASLERTLAQKYGYRIVADFAYPAHSRSLVAEVQALKDANPDVWLPTWEQGDAVLFARTARRLGWNPRMILVRDAGQSDPGLAAVAAAEAEGYMTPSLFPSDRIEKNPVARAFNPAYRARTGRDLDDLSARAVTGLVTLLDAINRAASTEPAAIRAALARTDIKPADLLMPWTGVRFDETGQNIGVRAIVLQLQGGRYRTVWPFDGDTPAVIYPLPRGTARR
jgi:branched-chain amino acid transport system substrate-binding protein